MCQLCSIYINNRNNIIMESEFSYAIRDENYFGVIFIVSKNHKNNFFELSYNEQKDMNMMIKNCKYILDNDLNPDGYNIKHSIGFWGGQRENHCYAELIPRFAGDTPITELGDRFKPL